MLYWNKFCYVSLELVLKLFIKSKVISSILQTELDVDIQQPLLYVLPYNSIVDLLTLRIQCLKHNFPDPLKSINIDGITLPRYTFIYDKQNIFFKFSKELNHISIIHNYLDLHRSNPKLNMLLVPVSIMFGRSPGKKIQKYKHIVKLHFLLKKVFAVLWFGRDSFIQFSRPLSLQYIVTEHGSDDFIVQKLIRIVRIHFARRKLVALGPRLPTKQNLLNKLLNSKFVEKAVEDEMRSKNISFKKAQNNASKLIEEIAANFSYEAIRFTDRILRWTWNKLYQGLHVHNAERVRNFAERGHEIVYIPCHRSHMDYLLLSYVLYNQGLVPPHIVAGINLNFWPVGSVLRRLGAFFIRRTFKGNKLYSTIFREYLSELFTGGYSVEYFIEGGRSRTGRLLEPKTGTLTITIQAMLRGTNRPITLIPIYVGYEHIIEVSTYSKELRGASKEKEKFWKVIQGLFKLRNLGQCYVNFGEPITLTTWLSKQVPHWYSSIEQIETNRPAWLALAVDEIAYNLMVRINNATAVNAINLCSIILLSSSRLSITKLNLLTQINCYIDLLRNVPYSPDVTIPNSTPESLLTHALAMNKFTIIYNNIDDIICLSFEQAVLMTYYRNNIQHLLILPSLVANIICVHPGIGYIQMQQWINIIYPLLKSELFIRYQKQELPIIINNFITELIRQRLVNHQEKRLYPVKIRLHILELLAAIINDTLQRYAVIFFLLCTSKQINIKVLEKNSCNIAQFLSVLYGINAPEFFDKAVFSTLISTLRIEGYISNTGEPINEKISKTYNIIKKLITPNIINIIESINLINK